MAGFLRKNCCDGIYSSSVDVRFTKLCDNRCSFCIEDMQGIASLGKTNVDRMVASMKTNIELEGKDTVLILGGEPFLLLDELCLFIKQIRADVKHIYITTSIPKQLDLDDKRVRFIMDQIDGLNVSVHHWSWITNNQILKARSNHNRFKLLQELAWFYGGKIRLQCNLVKGGIETVEDVHKLIKLANKLGVAEVKLNELQDVGEDLYVSFDALFPELNLGNPYSTGCVTNITDHFEEAYFELTVKRACFMVNEHSYHGANWLDLIKVIAKSFFRRNSQGLMSYMKTVSGRRVGLGKTSSSTKKKLSKTLAKVARTIQTMDLSCHSRSDGCHNISWHDASCHPSYRETSGGCH